MSSAALLQRDENHASAAYDTSPITIPGVEGETFDFKGQNAPASNRLPDIKKDICAMAYVSGGTIVLGIDPVKYSKGNTIGYTRNGYGNGTGDKVGLAISHQIHEIEPVPKYETWTNPDDNKYYPILQIYAEQKGMGKVLVNVKI